MPNTFELIASSTVGAGGAASIDFTSIPSTYTDLCLKLSSRNTRNDGSPYATIQFTFNGSSANRTRRALYSSNGTSGGVGSDSGTDIIATSNSASSTANTFDNLELYIPNYAGSNYKSVSIDGVTENNATSNYLIFDAGLWSSTSAINQITITPTSWSFVQYSTAYLYGVKNA